jgi:hypothetical protein
MDTQTAQTTNTYRDAQSQITRRAHAYAKELGIAYSTAYTRATEEVGQEMTPPMTVSELNSWIARERSAERRQKAQEEPAPKVVKASKKDTAPKAEKSVTATYRAWCLEHDFIAPDGELAHFNGHTAAAFGAARSNLKREGFEFERIDSGWRITARPAPKAEPKAVTEDDVRATVGNVLGAALGSLSETVTRDVMAALGIGTSSGK